jgi:glutamate/tyrosine decarboxylase-like PLP-dependent enzyme
MADLLFNPQELSDARCMTEAFVDRYLAGLADRPVFPDVDREALRELINRPIPKEGETLEALFEELDRVIIPNATHTAHPRFLPYVQPSPDALSPFAETVAAVINQNCNLWHLSPAANAVEKAVLNWFAGMFGFPGTVGGIITSGGSMANLVALTAARDQKLGPAARRQGLQGRTTRLVLYTSDEAH